ncbi:hypothetical protein CDIK_0722 [Cucumispora dikerogammari]|nr:hypothetical protein CDIK_0722 [Cucumispora dikerogammari]
MRLIYLSHIIRISSSKDDSYLDELINKPINIFLAKLQYKHLALIKNTNFEAINHYLSPKSLEYQNEFYLNEDTGNYELKINNAKICVIDDLIKTCPESNKSTKFLIIREGISGFLIKNNNKCLTVVYDSSVRMKSCLNGGADEQLFDFRPVKKLKCDSKYKHQSRHKMKRESEEGLNELGCNKKEDKHRMGVYAPTFIIPKDNSIKLAETKGKNVKLEEPFDNINKLYKTHKHLKVPKVVASTDNFYKLMSSETEELIDKKKKHFLHNDNASGSINEESEYYFIAER